MCIFNTQVTWKDIHKYCMFHLLIFPVLLVLSTDNPYSLLSLETPKNSIRLIFAGDGAKFFHT